MQENFSFYFPIFSVGSTNDVFIAEDKIKIVKKPTLIPQRMKGILSKDDVSIYLFILNMLYLSIRSQDVELMSKIFLDILKL